MHFALVGAGGVGGYLGARLAQAGHRVAWLARGPADIVCKSDFCRIRYGGEGEAVDALGAALNGCVGVTATRSADIELDLWRKFVMLSSFSAVACMRRASIGQVLENTDSHQLLIEAGRPLEIEFLSGAVVRLGAKLGVRTPIHSAALRKLSVYASR